jgi:CO/xanthine dehydrogenase Mo-binding subunit
MKSFEYLAPASIDEALELLQRHGPQAALMAGGTDLMVWMNQREINPKYVVQIRDLPETRFIKQEADCVRVGALTTKAELAASEIIDSKAAALAEAARGSSGPQVRNLATIGGNLGTASPAGDLVVALVALDARVKIRSSQSVRELPVGELLVGPNQNALAEDEMITEIIIPIHSARTGSGFQKLGKRKAMSVAVASAAAAVTVSPDGKVFEAVRVALGSVAPTVVRAKRLEQALQGRPATVGEIARARALVREDISPITDIRGQAWYRSEVASVLAGRAVEDALGAATGQDVASARAAQRKRGKGIAGGMYYATVPAFPNPSTADVRMREDGSVILLMGSVDIGQGSDTVLSQIAAEALGVPYEHVTIESADTGTTPYDTGTFASRQTYAGGNAVLQAAEEVKAVLFEAASMSLGVGKEELEMGSGMMRVKDNPEKAMPIAAAARFSYFALQKAPMGRATFYPKNSPPDHNMQGQLITSFNYHATVAEVEVDTETGVVDVLRLDAVVDCGKAINPALVEGQIEGGAMQGVGWALREDSHPGLATTMESQFDPEHIVYDLGNYGIATALDTPDIHSAYVEVPDLGGPFGAKGAGEVTAMTPAPAVLNAIHDAVGVRLFELPATPEKVLSALRQRASEADADMKGATE